MFKIITLKYIISGSGIEMKDFTLHDNWHSQAEVHKCAGASFEEGNTKVKESLSSMMIVKEYFVNIHRLIPDSQ